MKNCGLARVFLLKRHGEGKYTLTSHMVIFHKLTTFHEYYNVRSSHNLNYYRIDLYRCIFLKWNLKICAFWIISYYGTLPCIITFNDEKSIKIDQQAQQAIFFEKGGNWKFNIFSHLHLYAFSLKLTRPICKWPIHESIFT